MPVRVGEILNKKLLILIMKTVMKSPEIEYIAILIDIVNLVITEEDQRELIVNAILKEEDHAGVEEEVGPFTYRRLLKIFESLIEVRSIKPLHLKVTR